MKRIKKPINSDLVIIKKEQLRHLQGFSTVSIVTVNIQEYVNGLGNGKWVDFNPEGIKECEGTYENNRVEGPVTFYYEDGSIKSEGQHLHWKKPMGIWNYYNKK